MNSAPSLWGRIGGAIRSAFVRPEDPRRFQQWVQFLDQPGGVAITADNALEISAVWACVNAITNAIAPAKWLIKTRAAGKDGTPDGSTRIQALPDDPLHYVLNVRPNPDMTAIAFRQALLYARLLWGNGYAVITKTASGKIAELMPMLPHRVVVRRDPVNDDGSGGALFYEYHQMNGGIVRLEQSDVLHLKGPGISGLMGDHVVARAAKSMGLAAAAERFASTYFGNNTVIGGVLTAPFKFPRDPNGKSSVADRIRDDWAAMHQGPNRSFKPAILEGGMEWKPLTTNATDAQLVDVRKFSVEDIARWFGVPGHLIGIAASAQGYGKNLEELSLGFVRNTLRPICTELEQEADYKLMSPRRNPAPFSSIDLAPLSHGDFKSRMEGYQIAKKIGVYNSNEIREFEGANHIGPQGDVYMVETTMQTVDRLLNPPAPPAPAGSQENAGSKQEDSGDGGPADGGDGGAISSALALEFFAGAFDRYAKRLANRETDLRERGKASEAEIAGNLTEERDRQHARVTHECREAVLILDLHPQDVLDALASIDSGTEPRRAALALLNRSKR